MKLKRVYQQLSILMLNIFSKSHENLLKGDLFKAVILNVEPFLISFHHFKYLTQLMLTINTETVIISETFDQTNSKLTFQEGEKAHVFFR